MSHTQGQIALIKLQARTANARDCYTLDVLERAMDEIVRNPDNPKPAAWQVRSAIANASKIVKQRRQQAPSASLDVERGVADVLSPGALADPVDGHAEMMCREWLRTADGLTCRDRRLLLALYSGFDAVMIAAADDRPVERVREQISRARGSARGLYEHALAA
jgi:DNA-directed RNA polymerase specialized sigma24 family protein